MLGAYLSQNSGNQRDVAAAIQPQLESFLRVAYPEYFPPGTLLGVFRSRCAQQLGIADEILNGRDTQELADLIEYANKFHHDTNPAWETDRSMTANLEGLCSEP